MTTVTLSAQTPKTVADAFVSKMEKTALQANFIITVSERANEPMSYRGNIQMLSDKFHFKMDDIEVYFDGKTQWTYQAEVEEISISEPTAEELTESNPLLLAKALKNTCVLRFSDTEKDANAYIIDFYPQDKMSNILKLTLKLRKTDYMPQTVTLKEIQGKTTTLKLSNQQFGIQTNDGTFMLNKAAYSNAIINDLR